ncbi:MAG: DoxX family protein [Ignavibacteria bacterium]|nr:DoxX family protein [Ignavibacteria bacterium]MCC7157971.1 DoxX family protein [Ignavibacteria bacterium]
MYLLNRIDSWSEKHHPLWLDFFRVLLGVILVWQAIYFIVNKSAIVEIVQQYGFGFYTMTAAHVVIGAHLLGGVLILAGLLTRIAVIIQIPILICNLLFVIIPNGFMSLKPEAGLTLMVIALVILFLFEGSGRYSLDEYLKRHND